MSLACPCRSLTGRMAFDRIKAKIKPGISCKFLNMDVRLNFRVSLLHVQTAEGHMQAGCLYIDNKIL